jgi:5-methylcytosine-specific restriction endonuclease McrA
MKPRKPIPRVSKARRARSGKPGKLGIIRLWGKDMEPLRTSVFLRDCLRCRECGKDVTFATGHLAHIRSRGAGGSDTEENTRLLCGDCHRDEHQKGIGYGRN